MRETGPEGERDASGRGQGNTQSSHAGCVTLHSEHTRIARKETHVSLPPEDTGGLAPLRWPEPAPTSGTGPPRQSLPTGRGVGLEQKASLGIEGCVCVRESSCKMFPIGGDPPCFARDTLPPGPQLQGLFSPLQGRLPRQRENLGEKQLEAARPLPAPGQGSTLLRTGDSL